MRPFLLNVLIVLSLWGCSQGSKQNAVVKDTNKIVEQRAFDTLLTDVSLFLSGNKMFKPTACHGNDTTRAYVEYKQLLDSLWSYAVRTNIIPMKTWASTYLPEGKQDSGKLFYPFGGPDILYPFVFFPSMKKYLLFGLEPVGKLVDFTEKLSKNFYYSLLVNLQSALRKNFFRTIDMTKYFALQKDEGSLTIALLYCGLTKHKILSLHFIQLLPDGKEKLIPYEQCSISKPDGFCLKVMDSTGRIQEFDYFSVNVINDKLIQSPFYAYLRNLDSNWYGMTKAASYLMQFEHFTLIRDFFLSKIKLLLTDDTGVDYSLIKKHFSSVQLFGFYHPPISEFSYITQKELQEDYKTQQVIPIVFRYGYGKGKKLILAKNKIS